MIPTVLRMAAIVVLGSLLGLGWNSLGGRGLALDRNVYLRDDDETVTPAEAKVRFDRGALFLDAREAESYRMGHVAGALSLPSIDFQRAFPALEPQLRSRFDLVVYCDGPSCEASHLVARWLREKGIQAAVFVDGWPAWSGAGHPSREGNGP